MAKGILLSVDAQDCPVTDNVIIKDDCVGCEYKSGFEMFNGMFCVRCKYFESEENNNSNK